MLIYGDYETFCVKRLSYAVKMLIVLDIVAEVTSLRDVHKTFSFLAFDNVVAVCLLSHIKKPKD